MSIFTRLEKKQSKHLTVSDVQAEVFYQVVMMFGFCKYYPNPKRDLIKEATRLKKYSVSGLNEFHNHEDHITFRTYLGPDNTIGNVHITLDHPHWVNNTYTQEEVDTANFLLRGAFHKKPSYGSLPQN